jgi:nucleoside-diphosphate-sugar epimerase
MNPRFSYGGGKIISELLAVNYGRKLLKRVCIYRPHNVYGPDMGWEHVIPQFVVRLYKLALRQTSGVIDFPIQGTGQETRSFCYIDDLVNGVSLIQDRGEHLGIYHIGTREEVSMLRLADEIATSFSRSVRVVPGSSPEGSVSRRCPDISKIENLGYRPSISLTEGVPRTVEWYWQNMALAPVG